MKSLKKYPVAALAPFVRYYWYFEIDEDELPFAQLSFPYGSFELICYLENPNLMRWANSADSFFEPDIFYAGQLTRPYVMTFNKKCRCVGASLHPWAGDSLYDTSSHEFTNELVALDLLETECGLYDQLQMCASEDELFHCLESYLSTRLLPQQIDPLVCHLAKNIINQPTREALNLHLGNIGLSRRRMEQRFIHSTGLPMGAFMRKVRFQKAVRLLGEKHPDRNMTGIGLQAGYYDQAHFISDFKDFAGLSPKFFCAEPSALQDFLQTMVPVN